jgi:hypothetical protein
MEGARHSSIAIQFANVADIDKYDVWLAVQGARRVNGQGFDLAFGGLDECMDVHGDVLRHSFLPAVIRNGGRAGGPCARSHRQPGEAACQHDAAVCGG